MSEFTFDIQYKPGRVNQAADALSRLKTEGSDQKVLDLEVPCLSVSSAPVMLASIAVPEPGPTLAELPMEPLRLTEVIDAQRGDDMCQTLLQKGHISEDDRGVLCRISPLDGAIQIAIPTILQDRCMGLFHLPRIAGHPGSTKMYSQMRRGFYWPRMAADIYHYVSKCPSCAKKSLRTKRKTTRMQLFPPNAPMEFIAMDILGPLTTTEKGNRFLLVITDRFSKLTRAYPLSTTTATVASQTFLDGWVASGYGIP